MNILGINGGPNSINNNYVEEIVHGQFHDAACVLLQSGKITFAIEEERLIRIKHTNFFPLNAIKSCLSYGRITLDDIDLFAFAISNKTLEMIGAKRIKNLLTPDAGLLVLREIFRFNTGATLNLKKVRLYGHHYCHALSAFYQSGFDDSLVLTLDGVGEGLSGSAYSGKNNKLVLIDEFSVDKSLGHLYLAVTEFLGMQIFDEYKVMGLAPYGDPAKYYSLFKKFYTLYADGNFEIHFNELPLLETICEKRSKTDVLTQQHKDIAASLQQMLEDIVFHLLNGLKKKTGHTNLCLAGGVALNCKLTGELLYNNLFDDIFVFPAAGDNGLSAGAALACELEVNGSLKNDRLASVSLGSRFSKSEVLEVLEKWSTFITFEKLADPYDKTAELLAGGEVVGWFSGRDEYGPRALGNRSIIADPRPYENRDRINAIVKMRESFRPFAPAVLEEYCQDIFEVPGIGNQKSFPFMSFTLRAKDFYRRLLGAVIHTDGTARVQTVSKSVVPEFWLLIDAFRKKTNIPVVLNTSFNNNHEPIVHSPYDAIVFLLTSNIDCVVIEGFLVRKNRVVEDETEIFIKASEHIKLVDKQSQEDPGFFMDVYEKKKFAVGEDIWNAVKEGQSLNYNHYNLNDEFKKLWRMRAIRVFPASN